MISLHIGALLLVTLPTVQAPADSVPLYDNLGTLHHAISTNVAKTQRYFDQGLRLVYAFNHAEAIRAFNEAARLDSNCAMCYWGVALAYGPNINAGMDSASGVRAYAAVRKALALSPRASASERAYIEAVAARYASVPPSARAKLDSAYARAMRTVVRRYPADLDAATLHAEALMDLRPWNYWTRSGRPYPGTREILALLEHVIREDPDHIGACHYYIHAVEAARPELAVPCAERLARLAPGAGHLVHMPAHIYIRVGRYTDAVESNVHAVHTDETYIADAHPGGLYPVSYYPHNLHFLAFAATMAGRSVQAIEAARALSAKVTPSVARRVSAVEPLMPVLELTLVAFGRWDEVLREPLPPGDLRFATGVSYYARGTALAATHQWSAASAALDTVQRIASATGAGDNKTVLEIAAHALAGEIAARRDRLDDAARHFQTAMRLEDGLTYNEPPLWQLPVRHSLGAVLLRARRVAEAEARYREDLKRFPENGWSLYGLAACLRARGASAEADSVEARFRRAWAGADVTLTASGF
jgi:tetratricopeptide (TPR) repeat protein